MSRALLLPGTGLSAPQTVSLDEDYLDDIATAFGQIVDSKSPYTSGHSARVALYVDLTAETMGLQPSQRRWLKRGALLMASASRPSRKR